MTFEESLPIIDLEISKRRYKWNLNSLSWMDFDDVSQIIRIHVFNKWSQYDQLKPIQPWLNTIISHQICNLIRNNYTNFARPCLRCDAAEGTNGCKIWTTQCSNCPLYAQWEKKRKSAYDIKMALPMENHLHEVSEIPDDNIDITDHIVKVNEKMKEILKPIEYKVYEGLFILHEEEEVVAQKIGFHATEKGRKAGYKQIKNIRKIIINKFKKCIEKGTIEI